MRTSYLLASAVLASLAVAAAPSAASAAVIQGFDLTGMGLVSSAQLPLAATTADPNIAAGGLDVSSNFSPGAVQIPGYVGPDALATDTGSAPIYMHFSVTPKAGATMSVSALNVGAVYQNAGELDILVSTDGTLASATQIATLSAAGSWTGAATSFDLSGVPAVQNVAGGTTLTFFVNFANQGWNDRGITQNGATDGNALEIVGTVAVPEPASLSLLGAAGLLFLKRRRR